MGNGEGLNNEEDKNTAKENIKVLTQNKEDVKNLSLHKDISKGKFSEMDSASKNDTFFCDPKMSVQQNNGLNKAEVASKQLFKSYYVYENLTFEEGFPMCHDFVQYLPESIKQRFESNGSFPFKCESYVGKENEVQFIRSENKYFYGQCKRKSVSSEMETDKVIVSDNRTNGETGAESLKGPSLDDVVKEGKAYILKDNIFYGGYVVDNFGGGPGVLITSDNRYFKGIWDNNMLVGVGVYIDNDGITYIGQFKNNLPHGTGEESWKDGTYYKGEYYNGKKHGNGNQKWPQLNSYYKGQFSNNMISGKGEYKWQDGRVYYGEWKENCMEGYGILTYLDGKSYEGDFKKGLSDGKGVQTNADGCKIVGSWKEGKLDGESKVFENSATSVVYWNNGVRGNSKPSL